MKIANDTGQSITNKEAEKIRELVERLHALFIDCELERWMIYAAIGVSLDESVSIDFSEKDRLSKLHDMLGQISRAALELGHTYERVQ